MNKLRVAALLLVAVPAGAATKVSTVRIKVLNSESRSVILDDSGVPKNCDGLNFDAYCHSSMSAQVTNTLLVQEGDGTPYRVTCAVDSRWSRCALLPPGESFDARKEKRGITVYYQDDSGKPRRQLYVLAAGTGAPQRAVPPEPPASAAVTIPPQIVKCSFTSTPAGAEIGIDGRFAGSTPSILALPAGPHVVTISAPGFAQWKRDLTVSSGSALTVSAFLQKAP